MQIGCEEVANEDIVKGYKVDTDTFIEVTKEELENVALESTRTIEIDEFVDRRPVRRYNSASHHRSPDCSTKSKALVGHSEGSSCAAALPTVTPDTPRSAMIDKAAQKCAAPQSNRVRSGAGA
jgi:hypothetical protein